MPVYGILIEKKSALLPHWVNRYFCNAAGLPSASVIGAYVLEAEKLCHSELVTFTNIHVWLPNSTPNEFFNVPTNDPGAVPAGNALNPVICGELIFGGGGSSYPSTKSFRIQVDSSELVGIEWSAGIIGALGDSVEAFDELTGDLCTKNGIPLSTPTANAEYTFRQISKRWYNRNP